MRNPEIAENWLRRAKSNMARARAGRISSEVLYEDLCFDAQQAVEKALKALCVSNEIIFPRTQDIAFLIELLEKGNVGVPGDVQRAKLLTGYAVEFRYPGDYESVDQMDYDEAVKTADKVLKWVKDKMEQNK